MIEKVMRKPTDMLCGSACLKYILYQSGNSVKSIPNMIWIVELANYMFSKLSCSIMLEYYNSKLMKDYFDENVKMDNEVVQIIKQFIQGGGLFREKKVDLKTICKYCICYDWIILNVKSDILFDNQNMIGHNHFIILESCNSDTAHLICPGQQNIYRQTVSTKKLMRMIYDNGQWILLMRRL